MSGYTWRAGDDLADDQGRIWLAVPWDDRQAVRRLGARWDGGRQQWFSPPGASSLLMRWSVLPAKLEGEDREFGAGLFVDLIPSTSWFTNVRSAVAPADWYRIRTMVYGRAGYRCEACGRAADEASGLRLEAHERFSYETTRAGNIQELRRLLCLCSACHAVTHLGLADLRGERDAALGHLRAVTGMSAARAAGHAAEAFALWERRSRLRWELDLRMIEAEGIELAAPAEAVSAR